VTSLAVWAQSVTPDCQVICGRHWHAGSFHLLATDVGKWCFLCLDWNLGVKVGQMSVVAT